jgi:hypothetical protein
MSGIKSFWNQTPFEVSFIKMEHRFNNGTIGPNANFDTDVWLPWVDTPDQFVTKVLVVEVVRETRFYFWESGSHIFYHEDPSTLEGPFGFNSDVTIDPRGFGQGRLVPGDSDRNDKIVEIRHTNGRFKVNFLKK